MKTYPLPPVYWRWVEEVGGGGGYEQPDHGSVPPLPWFLLASERFDQRGRSSDSQSVRARWDSNLGESPWNPTPHCQLVAVPVRYQLRWPG
jgi:hypothetical protein